MADYEQVPIPVARGKASQYLSIWEALVATNGKTAIKVVVEPINLRKVISAISARCRNHTKDWRLSSQLYDQGTLLWLEKKTTPEPLSEGAAVTERDADSKNTTTIV